LAFSPDGLNLLSSANDSTVKLWDVLRGTVARNYTGFNKGALAVDFHPEGSVLAAAGKSNQLWLTEIHTGRTAFACNGHSDRVGCLAFTPDGKQILTGSNDTTVRLWLVNTGRQQKTFKLHDSYVNGLVVSPDGEYFFTIGRDLKISRTSLKTGQETHRKMLGRGKEFEPRSLCLAGDGKQVAVGLTNGHILWLAADTLELIRELSVHTSAVTGLAGSPDGRWLVSGDEAGQVLRWKLTPAGPESPESIDFPEQPPVTVVAICRQSDRVAVGRQNGIVHVAELPQTDRETTIDWSRYRPAVRSRLVELLRELPANSEQAGRLLAEQRINRPLPFQQMQGAGLRQTTTRNSGGGSGGGVAPAPVTATVSREVHRPMNLSAGASGGGERTESGGKRKSTSEEKAIRAQQLEEFSQQRSRSGSLLIQAAISIGVLVLVLLIILFLV
jgi:WD40 repeat protein